MSKIFIMRHGHNFEENETPRRIGCRTNLSLSVRGKEKIEKTSKYLKENFSINKIISASLIRTIESANIIKSVINFTEEILIDRNFDEIDYGPDENQTEEFLLKRIGAKSLYEWEEAGVLPDGWIADIEKIREAWSNLANIIKENENILVVTSSGIAKFAPNICSKNCQNRNFKINPGNLSLLVKDQSWQIKFWNLSP